MILKEQKDKKKYIFSANKFLLFYFVVTLILGSIILGFILMISLLPIEYRSSYYCSYFHYLFWKTYPEEKLNIILIQEEDLNKKKKLNFLVWRLFLRLCFVLLFFSLVFYFR